MAEIAFRKLAIMCEFDLAIGKTIKEKFVK